MEFLQGFINTLGLDRTFFIQFFQVALCYVVSFHFLLKPYIERFKKKEAKTTGSVRQAEQLDLETEELKKLYNKQAVETDEKFQKIFSAFKKQADENYIKELARLGEQHEKDIKNKAQELSRLQAQAEQDLKKDKELLVDSLVKKLRGVA